MTAGLNTAYNPYVQYGPNPPVYGGYGQTQPVQTPPQSQYGFAPQPQPYPSQSYPQQNYYYPPQPAAYAPLQPVTPPVVQAPVQSVYAPQPVQGQMQHTPPQAAAPQGTTYNPAQTNAGQAQNGALPNIPYEYNVLNMDSIDGMGIQNGSPAMNLNGPQGPQAGYGAPAMTMQDSAMNAKMPAPDIQTNHPQSSMQKNSKGEIPYVEPAPLDIGVVNAPDNHNRTPITDAINRQNKVTRKETLQALSGKKSAFNAGNISTACTIGAFSIPVVMLLVKIIKTIKHK